MAPHKRWTQLLLVDERNTLEAPANHATAISPDLNDNINIDLPTATNDGSMNSSAYAQQQQRPGTRMPSAPKAGIGNGLVGTGGWSGGAGLGYGVGSGAALGGLGAAAQRAGQLSGFAQVMGGGGGGGTGQSLDMSDFPSLSAGPRHANAAPASGPTGSLNYNTVQHPRGQQQSQPQPPISSQQGLPQGRAPSAAPSQQSLEGQLDGTRPRPQDDFPALGCARASLNGADSAGLTSPGQQKLPPTLAGGPHPAPIGTAQRASMKRYADMTDKEKYGLVGLLAAVQAREQRDAGHTENIDSTLPPAYRSSLFPGQSLDNLDLDLTSPEPLLPTFHVFSAANPAASGPFDYTDRMTIPDYTLPSAYQVGNVPPIEGRMDALSDETLFFIFYSQPRDLAQQRAATELERRDWRWHRLIRQWLRRDSPPSAGGVGAAASNLALVDHAPRIAVGTPSVQVGPTSEKGVYVFFDAQNWRRIRREFVLEHEELDSGTTGGGVGPSVMAQQMGWGGGGGGAVGVGMNGMGFGGPVQAPTTGSLGGGAITAAGTGTGGSGTVN